MKKLIFILSAAFAIPQMALMADIVVPGADGQDCGLTITQDTVIDLSLATTATWNASYNSLAAADPNRVVDDFIGKGVYDPGKWAVVFRYTDVSIAAGATVTFKNHPSRAPVVWLVSGNVDIAGTVSLNGNSYRYPPEVAGGGPGGFRGGVGTRSESVPTPTVFPAGDGLGPSGGYSSLNRTTGYGGSYATASTNDGEGSPLIYGNPSLLPLVGGSGGGGAGDRVMSGGGGGGAILIATASEVAISGSVTADGGEGDARPRSGANFRGNSGGGSGGGIRVVSGSLTGAGTLSAMGGVGSSTGGQGRVRLERVNNTNTLSVAPAASSEFLTEGATAQIWLPDSAPIAKLISLGADQAPKDPRAEFGGSQGPDLIVGDVPTTQAVIETTNLPQTGSQVQLRITPQHNAEHTIVAANYHSQVSENPLVLRWVADVPITNGYSAIQIRIVAP